MNRQAIFDHFIKEVNGKGRCVEANPGNLNGLCLYAKDGHPGCAIGCQPEFKQTIKKLGIDAQDLVGTILNLRSEKDNSIIKLSNCIFQAFGAASESDESFLYSLQKLHDCEENWFDMRLTEPAISIFKAKFKLA